MDGFIEKIGTALYLPLEAILGGGELFSGEKRIYWIYLITSTLLALYVYIRSKRKESFSNYLFHKKVWFSKSAFVDYAYIFFNSLIKVFLLSALINWGKYIAFYTQEFFIDWFGYKSNAPNIWLVSTLFVIVFTIIEDFFSFFIHWLHHKIPWLWEFHKIHHSATVLNPITQYRIHPLELLLNNISHLLALGLTQGMFSWYFYDHAAEITTISINIFALIFLLWGANLRHSHVRLNYFSWLEHLIISPYQHQIHHSDNPKHFNKNLGSKLAIWDWMFGSLVKSKEAKNIKFGIGDENKDFEHFFKSLITPFIKLFKKQ